MLVSASVPGGPGLPLAHTASSHGLPCKEEQNEPGQRAFQASSKASVPPWEQADVNGLPVPHSWQPWRLGSELPEI